MKTTHSDNNVDWLHRRIATGVDLTTLRDTETTLQEIVRHTRGLMRTDMAYVSFTDFDRNETVIRKNDGVRTAAYASLRQPLGTGLLGRVAIGHASYWSSDYLRDESLHHMGEIDAVVRAEDTRALLGTPLTVVGRVIGALVVADRIPRDFSAEEVRRLESIAAQAAIAIDNAMRHDHAISLLEELGGEQQRSAAEFALVTGGLELDRRLMDAVASGAALSSLVTIGAKALNADLWFEEFPARAASAASTERTPPDRTTTTTITVTAAGERFGHLIVSRSLGSPELDLLERVGVHLALAIMFRRAQGDAELRQHSEAIVALAEDRSSRAAELRRILGTVGLPDGHRVCWVLIESPEPLGMQVVRTLAASRTRTAPFVAAVHDDHVCVLTTDPLWVAELPELFRKRSWTLRAGTDWVTVETGDMAAGHRRAELALSSMIVRGRAGIADGAKLGLVTALLHLARRGELPHGLTEGLEPLIDYDRRHRSELVRTAQVYFETDENVARSSEVLSVHRNTVRQRLERIGRLLGPDWIEMPRKLDLQLALRAYSVMPQEERT